MSHEIIRVGISFRACAGACAALTLIAAFAPTSAHAAKSHVAVLPLMDAATALKTCQAGSLPAFGVAYIAGAPGTVQYDQTANCKQANIAGLNIPVSNGLSSSTTYGPLPRLPILITAVTSCSTVLSSGQVAYVGARMAGSSMAIDGRVIVGGACNLVTAKKAARIGITNVAYGLFVVPN